MASVSQLPLCKHRYAIIVSYLGSRYNGSQRQVSRDQIGDQDTVQEALEWSLESFLPKKYCRLTASSRTDKGVHALMNCYSLPLQDYSLPTEKLRNLANSNLIRKNHDIFIKDVLLAPAEFHPRKNAISREYIYRIAVMNNARFSNIAKRHNPFDILHHLPITELYRVLPLPCFDQQKALEAIDMLKGSHDFASFATKQTEEDDTIRDLEASLNFVDSTIIDESKSSPISIYHFHFKSRSFLYNQVRRMVGAIISCATYNSIKLSDIKRLLDKPNSNNWLGSMFMAEPWGLYLSRINYDKASLEGSLKVNVLGEEKVSDCFSLENNWSDDGVENNENLTCANT